MESCEFETPLQPPRYVSLDATVLLLVALSGEVKLIVVWPPSELDMS